MLQPIDIAINRLYPGEKFPDKDLRWGKFTHSFHKQSLTVEELIAEVTQGNSFCPVMKDNYRKQENFISAQHIGLDDDRGISDSSIDALALDPSLRNSGRGWGRFGHEWLILPQASQPVNMERTNDE